MQLLGGYTTKGPLTITGTVFGNASYDNILTRRGAKAGDGIYVSGPLGASAYAYQVIKHYPDNPEAFKHLLYPKARIEYGRLLAGYASSAIDISDGLLADLSHVLTASSVGAVIEDVAIPIASHLPKTMSESALLSLALTSGDEYELCFTLPYRQEAAVLSGLK